MELRGQRPAWLSPQQVSVVIPAFNEEDGIGAVVAALQRPAAPGARSWWWTTARPTRTAARARGRGRARGAPSLQQGQRRRGEDGHPRGAGRGRAADGRATASTIRRTRTGWSRGVGVYDMVIGARAAAGPEAGCARSATPSSSALASWLTGREIPDLTSGFRAARRDRLLEILHLLPNGFSYPTTSCLAFLKAGHNVGVRADPRARARGPEQDPRAARRRAVPAHHLEDRHPLQPAQGLLPHRRGCASCSASAYGAWNVWPARQDPDGRGAR